ncbi:MAG: hypothetical protein MZV70_38910 [Desulfobacterales bacterium]|nr:hypothetical protein [Desulfobacterales bacterium]
MLLLEQHLHERVSPGLELGKEKLRLSMWSASMAMEGMPSSSVKARAEIPRLFYFP